MRAIAIAEDRSLEPTELEEPPLQPHEARVSVAFCGICGSDLHLRPSPAVAAGSVMGHEFSGTVSEVGADVEGFQAGDRVAIYPFAPCGECSNCRRGDDHVCQEAALTGLGLGMNPGGYAETVVVRRRDARADPGRALLRARGTRGTARGRAPRNRDRRGKSRRPLRRDRRRADRGDDRARDCAPGGSSDVVVVERNERRQERIRTLGIEAVGLDGVHDRILRGFGGEAPDVVLECAGNPAAPQLAIELVRSRGIVVLLGVLEEPVEISQLVLLIKEAQVRASFAYRRQEFQEAVELLAAGKLPSDLLITGTGPLEAAQAMFEQLEDPATEDIKILPDPRSC